MVLGTMIARIGDLGFTPNRTAALGLNLVLLVNLAGPRGSRPASSRDAAASTGSSAGGRPTVPVFALWAAAVVVVVPLLFAFS
jgi:hypothetical protein